MQFLSTLFTLALAATTVHAHGFLGTVTINGKVYKGTGDGGSPSNTAIRPTKPYDVGPVQPASNTDLRCGLSPVQNAALQANAKAGDSVSLLWVGQSGNWIHEVGPVMTYMAECTGVKDCTTFDASNAKWFKVDQKGFKSDGTTWYMADLFNGQPVSFTIPSNLKAGNYLVRSELIALHRANAIGGAEFYPNCLQLAVSGSGTGVPSETVSFPGAYSDSDPGILVPDIFNPGFKYTFPGGPVAKIVNGGSSVAEPDSGSGSASASSSKTKTSSSSPAKATSTTSVAHPAKTSSASTPQSTSGTSSAKVCSNKSRGGKTRRRRRSVVPEVELEVERAVDAPMLEHRRRVRRRRDALSRLSHVA